MGKNKKNNEKKVKQEVKQDVEKKVTEKVQKETKKEVIEKAPEKETKNSKEEVKTNTKEEQKINKSLIKKAKKANNDAKIIIGFVVGVLVIAFSIFGFYFYKLNSEYVATYDGGKVTAAEFEVYYKTFAPMLQSYGYPESILPEQIANKAALDKILVKMAKDEGVKVTDEDMKSLDDIFNDKQQIAMLTQKGIDIGKMRNLYINDFLITEYMKKLTDEAKEEDVINYIKSMNEKDAVLDMNEYNTSHILFKTSDETGKKLSDDEINNKRKKAEEILQRAKKGDDFATLAKEFSEDDGTKNEGGKYTMFADGNTMEAYEKAVVTLKEGQIYSTLVETEAGFHIIKLDKKVENGRAKSEIERKEYVDYKLNSLSEEKHVKIDTERLSKVVEKITGKKIEKEENNKEVKEENKEEVKEENKVENKEEVKEENKVENKEEVKE